MRVPNEVVSFVDKKLLECSRDGPTAIGPEASAKLRAKKIERERSELPSSLVGFSTR